MQTHFEDDDSRFGARSVFRSAPSAPIPNTRLNKPPLGVRPGAKRRDVHGTRPACFGRMPEAPCPNK
jgi:hypothetical protein